MGQRQGRAEAHRNRRRRRGPGGRRRGFTLIELLTVLAVLCLLMMLLVPSLAIARRQAKLAACAAQMRCVGAGLAAYAAEHNRQLPPFAFSDQLGDLPLSGHWAGSGGPSDPGAFGRRGVDSVNLGPLLDAGMVSPAALVCPAAEDGLGPGGVASYFPHSGRFSTYCLRMPHSGDLFRAAPELKDWNGRGLLAIYTACAGGQSASVAVNMGSYHVVVKRTVPLVRFDRVCRETDPADGSVRTMDPIGSPMLADTFWRRGLRQDAGQFAPPGRFDVRWDWWHDEKFNVMLGDGSVHRVDDDGTVAANSGGPAGTPADDGAQYAGYAVRVWRYFADKR